MDMLAALPARSLALLALALLAVPPSAPAQDLEKLLERARAGRSAAETARAPEVRGWITDLVAIELQAAGARPAREAERLREKLANCDTAGARALLCFFRFADPAEALAALKQGPPPVPSSKQAQYLALAEASSALKSSACAAVAPDLVSYFEGEASSVRRAILELLPHLNAAEVVQPFLVKKFEEPGLENSLRALALGGLLEIDSAGRQAWLERALIKEPAAITAVALKFLTARQDSSFDALVDQAAVDPLRPNELFEPLFLYWKALPKLVEAEELLAWLDRVERNSVPEAWLPVMLGRLGRLPLPTKELEPKVRRLAETLTGASGRAAQILLANLGDRAARRALLDSADLVIERENEGSWTGTLERAQLHLALNDPGAALDDLRRALKLNQSLSPFVRRPCFVAQARAYALQSKLDKAADSLGEARLSPEDRKQLSQDPDFSELVAHPRHGEVLKP